MNSTFIVDQERYLGVGSFESPRGSLPFEDFSYRPIDQELFLAVKSSLEWSCDQMEEVETNNPLHSQEFSHMNGSKDDCSFDMGTFTNNQNNFSFLQEEKSQINEKTISHKCKVGGRKNAQDSNGMTEKKLESLSERNLKLNFGTGLVQFLEFKKDLEDWKKNEEKAGKLKKLIEFLLKNAKQFISFAGWKALMKDETYGQDLRRACRLFFGKSFAQSYISFSKVKEEYKGIYRRKASFFEVCGRNPELMKPCFYKKF